MFYTVLFLSVGLWLEMVLGFKDAELNFYKKYSDHLEERYIDAKDAANELFESSKRDKIESPAKVKKEKEGKNQDAEGPRTGLMVFLDD